MKKLYIGVSVLMLLASSSCNKFDEFNTNPDGTTVVTPEMIATGAEMSEFLIGGDAKAQISYNALPKFVAYVSEGAMEAQYNSIGSVSYDSYLAWVNLDQMVDYAKGGDFEASFRGLSHFIKAFGAYRMTMMTGDIPYSEAAKGKQGVASPKYDTQESVFASILGELKSAEAQFAAGRAFTGDIIYDGDVAKWRKASNAFQLKVLMSLSKKITPEQKSRFAEIVAAGNLMESNDDNLQVVYTTKTGTWHPLYNQKMFAPYTVLSTVVVDEFIRLADRRLFYFAEPAKAQIEAGKSASSFDAYAGADPSVAFETLNVAYQAGAFSVINNRYQAEMAGDPLVRLSYTEQCFILAEAAELGWISGDAETYYNNGVKAALAMVGTFDTENKYCHGAAIDDAYIGTYLAGAAAYGSTQDQRLKQIWMQRYLANFMQDGYGAYFEFRRTGFPELPNNPDTSLNTDDKSKFPVRWSYPSDERKTNFDHLDAALQRQFTNGYDGTNEQMWLLK